MICATYSFFKSIFSIPIYCEPAKLIQLTVKLHRIVIFSVSNNETQWILDFGSDSVVLSVKDLIEILQINSLENPMAAWSFFLSQTKEFLDNHLPRVPKTPNQQGSFEMREKVLSSVGAQNTDTSG